KSFNVEPILSGSLFKITEQGKLPRIRCNKHFSANFKRDLVFGTEGFGQFCPALAQSGLQTARLVIDPSMDDPAV
ncbi:hypothetical protein PSYMO_34639, partial [Pseudomonas amygdali pv. mori str. 301020]